MRYKKNKELDIPVVTNIPIEVEQEINDKVSGEMRIIKKRCESIAKRYMKLDSSLRRVADYLWDYFKEHLKEAVSYKQIAEETKVGEKSIPGICSELAGWEDYPLKVISARDENHKRIPGFIQLSTKDYDDTENWLLTRTRAIIWQQQRADMTERSIKVKRTGIRTLVKKIKARQK